MTVVTAQTIRRPIRQVVTHVAAATISAALAVGLTLQLSAASPKPSSPVARNVSEFCVALPNATPSSPAAFRLADEATTLGSC